MSHPLSFGDLLPRAARPSELFAILSLGVVESLAGGVMTSNEAVRRFFHADNCLFVRAQLEDAIADEVMGRGVQLPDLFDALPGDEGHREFQHELVAMRSLCLRMLEEGSQVA